MRCCGDAWLPSTFLRLCASLRAFAFSQLWLPILATLLVVEKLHTPGLIVLHAVLMPALVLSTVLQPASLLGRVLEWRPLRWLGTISYSLYLWQMLFLPGWLPKGGMESFITYNKRHGICWRS